MPSRPQRTIVQSTHPYLGEDVDRAAKEIYIKDRMTPAEYINYISGQYGDRPYWVDNNVEYNHPHSTPRNNDKALDRLRQHLTNQKGGHPTNELMRGHAEDLAQAIIKHRPLSPEMIHHVMEDPKLYGMDHDDVNTVLRSQPNTDKSHLMKLASNPRSQFGSLIDHPAMDREVADTLMTDPNRIRKLDGQQVRHLVSSMTNEDPNKQLIDEKGIINLLQNNSKGIEDGEDFDKLAEKIQPDKNLMGEEDHSKRKGLMDDILGINGGEYTNEADHSDNPDHFHYDNWSHGTGYNPKTARAAAGSKFLTPDQIDHIKRHGDFDEKYALFNNKHIDPKHAGEMYNHWVDDDSDKGYDLDELKDKIKEEHPYADNHDSYYEDAQNEEQEAYPFSKYIDENVNDDELMDGMDEDDWIEHHLDNNHDWEARNPAQQADPAGNEDPTIDHSRDKESHPDYKARYDEAQKAYDDTLAERKESPQDALSQRAMDKLYEGYDDYIRDDVSNTAERLYNEKMDNAHEDPEFLPDHLPHVEELNRQRREAEEIAARQKVEEQAAKDKPELDKFVPQRSTSHPYGDLQHHVQMAQGYANANGGKIDIGTLNKLHPNVKDKWKAIFGDKGKLSSQELDQKFEAIPKTPYAISHQIWEPGLQNLNERNQVVYRLDHTPESMAAIKADPAVHNVFNKIADVSKRSGHPTNANTIAWSRVDANDPKHWMIDEVQSDFGSAARDYLDENGKKDEADAVNKVIAIHKNWREALINHVINEAKKHGVERVSTHSPESKAAHTGAGKVHTVYKDSYQKVPRSMGFVPAAMETLPLTEHGRKEFNAARSGVPTEDLMQQHKDAMVEHAKQSIMHGKLIAAPEMLEDVSPEDQAAAHTSLLEHHSGMFSKHRDRLAQLDPTSDLRNLKTPKAFMEKFNPDFGRADRASAINNAINLSRDSGLGSVPVYGFDAALKQEPQAAGNTGHTYDLNPAVVKKSLDEVEDLMKMEKMDGAIKQKIAATMHLLQQNEDVLDQIHQSNPQAYVAIKELVESMVQMAKKTTGKDPATDVHKLQIQNELDSHQNPEEQQQSDQGSGEAPSGGGGGHLPHTDKPLQQKQLVFGPGAVRRYDAQDARVKDTAGEWHSQTGKAKEGQGGANG